MLCQLLHHLFPICSSAVDPREVRPRFNAYPFYFPLSIKDSSLMPQNLPCTDKPASSQRQSERQSPPRALSSMPCPSTARINIRKSFNHKILLLLLFTSCTATQVHRALYSQHNSYLNYGQKNEGPQWPREKRLFFLWCYFQTPPLLGLARST